MIDGIKIDCSYLPPDEWRKHPLLKYYPKVDESTGEIIPQILKAYHMGLVFVMQPSRDIPDRAYMQVVGSLHRYHRGGGTNATDFKRSELTRTIEELHTTFKIAPKESQLRNLEFGVNIELPISAKAFLKGMVCMPDKKYGQMNVKRPNIGKVCVRSEYVIKIYDKGKQNNNTFTNILRVEIKVIKMRYLAKHGIRYLSDLLEPQKLLSLGKVLIGAFNEIIYYDGSIVPSKLTARERQKLEEYTNPHRWLNMTKHVRYKAKKSAQKFFLLHGGIEPKRNALLSIYKKWFELSECTQIMGDHFTAFFSAVAADSLATFSPLECLGEIVAKEVFNNREKEIDILAENPANISPTPKPIYTAKDAHFCKVCKRDISMQRKSSLYCSVKYFGRTARRCRDRAANQMRTERRRAKRAKEKKRLEAVTVPGN